MGKQDWTPEPWITDGSKVEGNSPGAMHDIAHCPTHPHLDWTGSDNANRIVACVNALAGIPDPAAYIKAMQRLHSEAEYVLADLSGNADNRNRGRYTLVETARIKKLAWAVEALRTLSTPESEVNDGSR